MSTAFSLATSLGLALDPTVEHRKVRKSNYIRSKQRLRSRERKLQVDEQAGDLIIEPSEFPINE